MRPCFSLFLILTLPFLPFPTVQAFPGNIMTLHMALLSTAVPLPRPFASGRHFQAGAPAGAGTWFFVVFNTQPRTGFSDKTKRGFLRSWVISTGIPPHTILLCQRSPGWCSMRARVEGRRHQPGRTSVREQNPMFAGMSMCFPVRHAGNPNAVSTTHFLLPNLIP